MDITASGAAQSQASVLLHGSPAPSGMLEADLTAITPEFACSSALQAELTATYEQLSTPLAPALDTLAAALGAVLQFDIA